MRGNCACHAFRVSRGCVSLGCSRAATTRPHRESMWSKRVSCLRARLLLKEHDVSTSRRWGRRTSAALLASVVAAAAVALSSGVPAGADPASDVDKTVKASSVETLGAHDEQLVAQAQARHERSVVVIIATEKGRSG